MIKIKNQIKAYIFLIGIVFCVLLIIQTVLLITLKQTEYEFIDVAFITLPSFFGIVISILGASLLDKIAENKRYTNKTRDVERIIEKCIIPELKYAFNAIKYKHLKEYVENSGNYSYGIGITFELRNFNEIKFELAKYKVSNFEILFEIYQILYTIQKTQSFSDL